MKKTFVLTAITSSLLFVNASAFADTAKKNSVASSKSISTKANTKSSDVDVNDVSSLTNEVDTSQSKNAIFIEGKTYHTNNNHPEILSDSDVSVKVDNNNKEITLSIESLVNGKPLEAFNFKNLPGTNGQIHALWIRNDFSQANNKTIDITGTNTSKLRIPVPKNLGLQDYNQCDAIVISYQLQNAQSPSNIIRFAKYEKEDNTDVLKLYNELPSGCVIQPIDTQNSVSVTSKNSYLVNISANPSTMQKKKVFDVTVHATKEGKEHFLPNVETVLIKKDFSGLNFLVPSKAKFANSPISAWHGINYSANISESGEYIVGVGFGEGNKREWVFTSTIVK